jgi:serine protease Do
LQTEQAPTLPAITFGDPATVRIGDRVLAIGHPEQGGMWTLTSGLISAEFNGTVGKHVFQTDTGLNRGNSAVRYSTVSDT